MKYRALTHTLSLCLLFAGGPALGAQQPASDAPPGDRDGAPADVDLDELSLAELDQLAVQIARRTEALLLTPEAALVKEQAELLELPDTGVFRLLERSFADGEGLGLVLARGGGAYYSFETREHSYNCQPDVGLEQGLLKSGFYGGTAGLVVPFGEQDLAALPTSAEAVPESWSDVERAAWSLAWSEPGARGRALREAEQQLGRQRIRPAADVGATFLVHRWSDDEQHHLVALRVLARDDRGATLAWRRLKQWRATGLRQGSKRPNEIRADVPPAPEWLADLDLEGLRGLLRSVRAQAEARLLTVPESVREAHGGWQEQLEPHGGVGFCRILQRGRWDALVSVRGGGAYVSFEGGSNDYDDGPHLDLQHGRFGSGFAGSDEGWFADLGELDDATMLSVMLGAAPPKAKDPIQAERLRLLLDTVPSRESGRLQVPEKVEARTQELMAQRVLMDSIDAVVGHTYVLRTLLYDEADFLIVFTVVGEHEGGLTLFGRIVERRR